MLTLGHYVHRSSPVHRLDPRVKLLSVLALSGVIVGSGIPGALLTTWLLLLAAGLSRLGPGPMRWALRPVRIFLLLFVLLHLFMTPGRPLPPFPEAAFSPTIEGLGRGLMVAWRFVLLVTAAALLTMTTQPEELVAGIERLLRPFNRLGLPSHDVAITVSLALRALPMLLDEYDRIKTAQMARAADFRAHGLRRRIRAAGHLLLPLLFALWRRTEELALAMEARGYRRGPRTTAREWRLRRTDVTASGIVFVVIAGDLAFRFGLGP